jgi:hypothetical protein
MAQPQRKQVDGVEASTIPVEPEVERERIASLAYAFWLERGCPDESSQEDWFRAERHLASRSDENVYESKAA